MHLTAGCLGGAVILLMSFTGVLLMYERQMLAWLDRGVYRASAPSGAQRLDVENLLQAVRGQQPRLPGSAMLTLRSDSREPAEISLGREGAFYVNPYTGQLAGRSSESGRSFFQQLRTWHRWLGVQNTGPGRDTARAITGACNLAFLFLVLSGAYLWIPREWSARYLRPIAWFRGGLSGRARDFNWHNAIGIWSVAALFFVVLTAVPMSYSWANDLLYRLAGSKPPASPGRPAPREDARRGRAPAIETVGLNALWAAAETQVSGWSSITSRVSPPAGEPVSFVIDRGDCGQPQKRVTVTLDRSSAAVLRVESFDGLDAGRRLRLWVRFVHTGEAYGVIGQTVAGICSAGGVMLVWTGVSLALRRFWACKRRRSLKEEPEPVGARSD
jgi:uncharacterized iron-regulated membrane protein